MPAASDLCQLLHTHAERDKVLCLASYVLKTWGGAAERPGLLAASARLAAARATARLFDDPIALRAVYNYGLGTQDGMFWGTLGAAGGCSTLLYLQAEKLIWLMDVGLLLPSPDLQHRIRVSHKLFWSLASAIAFIRSLRNLHAAGREARETPRRRCAGARFTQACLLSSKCLLDTVHAVGWLPAGWLWGSRLGTAPLGAVASAAAAVSIAMHLHGLKLAKTK